MKQNKISIIIPIYNEDIEILKNIINHIWDFFIAWEVIVVDWKYNWKIKNFIDNINTGQVSYTYKSLNKSTRSSAMNQWARSASGNILLFLHVDTLLPKKSYQILSQLDTKVYNYWWFYKKFSPSDFFLDMNSYITNLRLLVFGSLLWDNAIFITKELFERVSWFPQLDLMEDIEMSKQLKKYWNIKVIKKHVLTSSRKFKKLWTARTLILMSYLRILYFLWASSDNIRKKYENI